MAKTKIENAWLVFGIIGILVFGGFVGKYILNFKPLKCIPEKGAISYGTNMIPTGKCCEGLVIKSPIGMTGGGFCVRPECDIECLSIGSKSEGWYLTKCETEQPLIKWTECRKYSGGDLTFYVIRDNICIETLAPIGDEKRFGSLSDCNEHLGIINPDKKYLCTEFWGNHPELTEKDFVCYFLYDPVCGEDGRTYSNDCVACRSNINWYTKRECD